MPENWVKLSTLVLEITHFLQMSKDKYPSIFSPQMEAIVFIILQIFFAKCAVLKIGEYLTIIPLALVGYEMIIANSARDMMA